MGDAGQQRGDYDADKSSPLKLLDVAGMGDAGQQRGDYNVDRSSPFKAPACRKEWEMQGNREGLICR
jgi:hypothetical protein